MTTNNEIDQGISIWLLKRALAVQQFGFGFFVVAAHAVGAGRQVQKQRRGAVLFQQGIQIMGVIGGCRGSDCSSLVVAVGEWCHECSGVTNADFYRLLPWLSTSTTGTVTTWHKLGINLDKKSRQLGILPVMRSSPVKGPIQGDEPLGNLDNLDKKFSYKHRLSTTHH